MSHPSKPLLRWGLPLIFTAFFLLFVLWLNSAGKIPLVSRAG